MASLEQENAASSADREATKASKPRWTTPRLVRHGSIRELTHGAASGSMADPMFGGAVGSGMRN